MDSKKCPYCFSEMDMRASICPSCRKKVGTPDSKGIARKYYSILPLLVSIFFFLLILGIFAALIGNPSGTKTTSSSETNTGTASPSAQGVIHLPFEIIGTYKRSTFSVVVPPKTTKEQLTEFVYDLKKAKDGSYLGKYFPPTTPGGTLGDYAIIIVYVFTDNNKASEELLTKYMEGSSNSKSDIKWGQKYAENVVAHYYHGIPNEEFGCLGLRDIDVKPTKKYKKLFATDVPY